jgi:hypothetical protein
VNDKPDEPWHINMMPVGDGSFYLYLHDEVRQASHTKVGDTVQIKLWFDHAYKNGPLHAMSSELQQALHSNELAYTRWHALPPSRQKEILRYLAGLKSQAAIHRYTQKTIDALTSPTAHFLGRDWINGT